MRMFVSAYPSRQAVEDLEDFLTPRRDAAPFRLTQPEQWHVTLAFLAHVPDRAYDELLERLAAASTKRVPMTCAIAGGGAFPNVGRARVLWAGLDVDRPDELDRLASGCRTAASTSGIVVDGARFRPHLTLGRLNRPNEMTGWVRLLDGYRGPTWTLNEVSLVASYLGEGPRGRPRYEVLETFALDI